MINESTTPVTVTNTLSPSVVLATTILQFPVYWDDMEMSWDSYGITWNRATDEVEITNISI
jgi:hypothetical protein